MSAPTRPSRSLDKFIVRLPPGMREQLADAAAAAGRSMNAEIVQRLEQTFPTAEKVLLHHRVGEVAMIVQACKDLQSKSERLEARLREPGLSASDRAAVVAEAKRTGALAEVLLQLNRRVFEDLETLKAVTGEDPVVDMVRTATKKKASKRS